MRFLICLLFLSTPALAELPDCAEDTAPCQMVWIENGEKRVVQIHPATASPTDESLAGRFVGRDGGIDRFEVFALADRFGTPTIRDMGSDGRMDIGLFVQSGMVNGLYSMFRQTETGFTHWETLFGHTFFQDQSGLLTATGRSSCCELVTRVHSPNGDDVADFALSVRPQGAPGPDGTTCRVLPPADGSAIRTHHADLIDAYCTAYESDAAAARASADLRESTARIVPQGTIFNCTFANGKEVMLRRDDRRIVYRYGPMDGEPELVLDRAETDVTFRPETGARSSRFAFAAIRNAGFTYTVTSGREYDVPPDPDAPIEAAPYHLLTVTDPSGQDIVQNDCLADSVFSDLHLMKE
ncbi:MAG: hypothetical protein AAF919_08870 [Pseudomonadota bacterium]